MNSKPVQKKIVLIRPRSGSTQTRATRIERPPALPVIEPPPPESAPTDTAPSTPPAKPVAVPAAPGGPNQPKAVSPEETLKPVTPIALPKPVLPKPVPKAMMAPQSETGSASATPLANPGRNTGPLPAPASGGMTATDSNPSTAAAPDSSFNHPSSQTADWPDDTPQDNSLFRALLRGLYDAILIVREPGAIVDCNRRALRFFQYSYAEICRDVRLPDLVSGLSLKILERMRETMASGRFTLLDAVCVRRDQTRFPVEIAISRITFDDRDDLVFAIRNVTRRRSMENQLRTEHQALENAGSGIVITDPEANITYANPAFLNLFGITEEAAHDRSIRSFWNLEAAPDDFVNAPLNNTRWAGEMEGRHASGRRFRVQGTADANRDAQGNLLGLVYSFTDITERYQAEQRIRREAEAQIHSAKQQDAFAGRLNIVSLSDIVQLIHSAGKTGVLAVLDDPGDLLGSAAFESGELIGATHGPDRGETAFRALLQSDGSAFQFDPEARPERDTSIQKSMMTLLMETAQQLDEQPGL